MSLTEKGLGICHDLDLVKSERVISNALYFDAQKPRLGKEGCPSFCQRPPLVRHTILSKCGTMRGIDRTMAKKRAAIPEPVKTLERARSCLPISETNVDEYESRYQTAFAR